MTDSITCTVTIDLTDLHSYVQIGEQEWHDQPVSLTDAVVQAAARHLVGELVKDDLLVKTRNQITTEMIRAEVEARIEQVLASPIRATNNWGEPTGQPSTVTEMVDAEITKQLTRGRDRYGNNKTVLDTVIAEHVNARLTADLTAAFNTAKQAMLEAATEAGKQAVAVAMR